MLTPAQWAFILPIIKHRTFKRRKKRGRPYTVSEQDILSGILWILKSGARWKDLPREYPPYQTCHRYFQKWVKDGTIKKVLRKLAKDLQGRGKIKMQECFIDATFVPAKKGDSVWVKPNGARVQKSWQLRTMLLFLSPFSQHLLGRTKASWSNKLCSPNTLTANSTK